MKFFKKNTRSSITDSAASSMAKCILKSQHWFAKNLEDLTANWRQRHQWVFLCLICALLSGLSVIAIVQSFRKAGNAKVIILKPITVPKGIYKEGRIFLITEKEFQQVQQFKTTHPDLQKERPDLFQNLNLVEQSYHSQQK